MKEEDDPVLAPNRSIRDGFKADLWPGRISGPFLAEWGACPFAVFRAAADSAVKPLYTRDQEAESCQVLGRGICRESR
jgi:hypothetical protein